MVFVKATKDSEAGIMPEQKLLEDMMAYNEELVKAGIMLAGDGLKPSSKGARIQFTKGKTRVVDGPFAETKELVAGYWLWEVKSWEEAVEWARRCPQPMPGDCEIELRPLFDIADFGDIVTPEIKEQEARLRRQSAALNK
jgi:hypothetical protein